MDHIDKLKKSGQLLDLGYSCTWQIYSKLKNMWVLALEAAVALTLLVLIVWWTRPRKKEDEESEDDQKKNDER